MTDENRIYTTGAYLVPREIEVDGRKSWRWLVESFNDDNFDGDGKVAEIYDEADCLENLFRKNNPPLLFRRKIRNVQ